jgi:hypothetical protein
MQENWQNKRQKHTEKTQRKLLVHHYVILRAQTGDHAHNTKQQPFLPPRRPPSTLVCFVVSLETQEKTPPRVSY